MMPDNNLAPPENEVDPGTKSGATANHTTSKHHQAGFLHANAQPRRQRFDPLAGNARRFGASRRMAPIPTCACGRCVRDPFVDRHRCGDEISDNAAEAAVAAVVLLDQLGTPGLLDERTCRAMWRVGHHCLALQVHRRTAGA